MCLVQRKVRQGEKNKMKKKMVKADMEITKLNKQKLCLESVRNSTIYSVSSRMYYQYINFKNLDYTRNIDFSLIFLQIFFQRYSFKKPRITVISPRFHDYTFFKNVSVSFVMPLTIKRDITLHKRVTVHIRFVET